MASNYVAGKRDGTEDKSAFVDEKSGLILEKYVIQKSKHWPKLGRHILAQYDEDTIVVYQAYKPSIAKYAVENQRFGGDEFLFTRMSWIKTNFLWMTYRCGWATKKNQEHVLAIRLSRKAFDTIIANAYTIEFQKSQGLQTYEIEVRLQWDPDHDPSYAKDGRRAIQLGLRGEMLKNYCTSWIVSITDITDLVKTQKEAFDKGGNDSLWTPRERVYIPDDKSTIDRIHLSIGDDCEKNTSETANADATELKN